MEAVLDRIEAVESGAVQVDGGEAALALLGKRGLGPEERAAARVGEAGGGEAESARAASVAAHRVAGAAVVVRGVVGGGEGVRGDERVAVDGAWRDGEAAGVEGMRKLAWCPAVDERAVVGQ